MEQFSSSSQSKFRSRRPHAKSRNGCQTCKQRRKKCDEKRPSCTRCENSLRLCVYSNDNNSPISSDFAGTPGSSIPSPDHSLHDRLSGRLPRSGDLSPAAFSPSPGILSEGGTEDVTGSYTDADLYFHYLNHTCKNTPHWHRDRVVVQVVIPNLALFNEPVCHVILAQSAACVCWDMICQGTADLETVRRLLRIGLEHHTAALEQMQAMTSRYWEADIQPIVATGIMMVPFAFAFQNINYWILSRDGSPTALSVTPREAIFLMRGIRTSLVSMASLKHVPTCASGESEVKTPFDTMFSSPVTDPNNTEITPSRHHFLFPVVAGTYHEALSQLQQRKEKADASCPGERCMTTASAAYDCLTNIMSGAFSVPRCPETPATQLPKFSFAPDSILAQTPSWLQGYVLRGQAITQTEPLTRPFLSFLSAASEDYIQLLLPLLDARQDGFIADFELTAAQVLALDLYAHWLVLMILVEPEAWWVGDFPVIALEGLIDRYGALFASMGEWWPASMLNIMMRLKQGS